MQDTNDPELELVGHFGGDIRRMVLHGSRLYLGIGPEFTVLDVSVPEQIKKLGWMMLPDSIRNISVAESYAHVLVSSQDYSRCGFYILDIADLANIRVISFYPTNFPVSDLAVAHNLAFVAADNRGLFVVDVADARSPQLVCTLRLPSRDDWHSGPVSSVAVQGPFAYVGTWSFNVVDVTDPMPPHVVGFCDLERFPEVIRLDGQYAYCGTGETLVAIDISDPTAPVVVATYGSDEEWGYVQDIAFGKDCVFVVGERESEYGSLDVLDTSNPAELRRIARNPHAGSALAVGNGSVFVVNLDRGVRILDTTRPEMLGEVGHYWVPRWIDGIAIAGTLAYLCRQDGLSIADLSDPLTPDEIGFYTDTRDVKGVVIVGSYAYLIEGPLAANAISEDGMGGGVCILDISQPNNPRKLSYVELPAEGMDCDFAEAGYPASITVRDERAYILWTTYDYHPMGKGFEDHLLALDVSDPTSPVGIPTPPLQSATGTPITPEAWIETIRPPGQSVSRQRLEQDGIVYAASSQGLMIYRRRE